MISARQLIFGAMLASAAVFSAGTATAQVYLKCDASASPFPCLQGTHFSCQKWTTCPSGSKVKQACAQWSCVADVKPTPPKCKPACKVGYICVSSSGGGESGAHCQKKSNPEQ